MKFTRVRFTSSLPWDAVSTTLTFVPTSGSGLVSSQGLVYCNGNPLSTAVTAGSGTLTLGSPLTITLTNPLPLTLTSFQGEVLERTNMLSWETSTEKNIRYHIVERSVHGTTWLVVGSEAGQFNTVTPTKYALEDKAPLPQAYYRLRSVDIDGRESRSNTILLLRKNDFFSITSVFPTPTVDKLTVQFNATWEEMVTVQIMDMTGRLVLQQTTSALVSVNTVSLTLPVLQAGIYTVTVRNSMGVSAPVRFLKQ